MPKQIDEDDERNGFGLCLRNINGYRVGLTGAVLEYAVKKYRSHRSLSLYDRRGVHKIKITNGS